MVSTYQFKKEFSDIEWIGKLIINDRPNCHMLYITCISGIRKSDIRHLKMYSNVTQEDMEQPT